MGTKPRIAVVSLFLDKQHGTECCVVEQLDRLAEQSSIAGNGMHNGVENSWNTRRAGNTRRG
jgi:hypothetical protein